LISLWLSQELSVIGRLEIELRRTKSMKSFKLLLNNLMTDESGQDLIEYALVAALVALGAVASMKTLGTAISTAFTNIGTTLTSAA
jgi:pilus assembly protein Flp/PilA